MVTEAIEKEEYLVQSKPMPDGVIEQLDELMIIVESTESADFMWLYEAAELVIRVTAKHQ